MQNTILLLDIWRLLDLDFYEFLHFLKAEIYQNNKTQSPKVAKTVILEFLNSPKLISLKIWMIEKSWIFHTVHSVQLAI